MYFFVGIGLISILSVILSLVYLYFGISLAQTYSISKDENKIEVKERNFIHNRIVLIALSVGIFYMIRGIISFFMSIKVFNSSRLSFIDVNLWDFCVFFFCELLNSLIIGYTKQSVSRRRFINKLNIDSYEFNKNYMKELENMTGNYLEEPLINRNN